MDIYLGKHHSLTLLWSDDKNFQFMITSNGTITATLESIWNASADQIQESKKNEFPFVSKIKLLICFNQKTTNGGHQFIQLFPNMFQKQNHYIQIQQQRLLHSCINLTKHPQKKT